MIMASSVYILHDLPPLFCLFTRHQQKVEAVVEAKFKRKDRTRQFIIDRVGFVHNAFVNLIAAKRSKFVTRSTI